MSNNKTALLVKAQYAGIVDSVVEFSVPLGFALKGKDTLWRNRGDLRQRLSLSLRLPRTEPIGYVEVFPGFDCSAVEELAARLQDSKRRPGFVTFSSNIGLLAPSAKFCEWPVDGTTNVDSVKGDIVRLLREVAIPFWEEFSTVERLIQAFENSDRRVCRGGEWFWQLAAAYCLVGAEEKALRLLTEKQASSLGIRAEAITRALQILRG